MSGFELERYLEELQEFVDIDSGKIGRAHV